MPSLHRSLLFRIDACPESGLIKGSKWLERSLRAACIHEAAVQKLRETLARRYKLKRDGVWITASLDDSFRAFFEHVTDLSGQGVARFGSGFLTERLSYNDSFTWYRLEPKREFNDRNRKLGATQLLSHPWKTYASTRFREAVERENLRGLVFGAPIFEPIRGDARHWFSCLPVATAGRGLDHVWAPPYEPLAKKGNSRLGADSARNDTVSLERLDPDVAELCARFPPGELHLKSYTRLWSHSLPETDFAGLASVAGTGAWGISTVIINRAAAHALLNAGVLEIEMLEPIEIAKNIQEAGVSILDEEIGSLPGFLTEQAVEIPMSTTLDTQRLVEQREPRDIFRSLSALSSTDEVDRVDLNEIRDAASRLQIVVPPIWQRLLTEFGLIDLSEFRVDHPSAWFLYQSDHEEPAGEDQGLPSRLLAVASTFCGDMYALDLDHVSGDGDCPLLKFDHEINQCVDSWPSVGDFFLDNLGE